MATSMSLTVSAYAIRYHLACGTIHREHVMVNATDLRVKIAANRRACCHVGLHDVPHNFDGVSVLEDGRIAVRLLNDRIPLCTLGQQNLASTQSDDIQLGLDKT